MQERREYLHVDSLLPEKFFEPPTTLEFAFKEGDFPFPPKGKDAKEKLESFFWSDDGKKFKEEFKKLTAKLLAFAQAHHIPGAKEAIEQFTRNFIDYTGSNVAYNSKVLPLYTDGVPSLFGIIKFIEHVKNNPNQCKDVLRNLMQEIVVCGPGVYTNLASAYMQLIAKLDKPNYFKSCREKLIRQFVTEMIPKNEEQLKKLLGEVEAAQLIQGRLRSYEDHMAGMEIHYVNGICNRYAHALEVNAYDDDYVTSCEGIILTKCMEKFEKDIGKYLSPELIVNYVIDNSEIQVKIDQLFSANPDKYEEILEVIGTALNDIGGREFASDEVAALLVRNETGKFTSRSSRCDALLAFYTTQGLTTSGYMGNNYGVYPIITNDRYCTLPGSHSLSLGYVQTDCDVILQSTFDPKKMAETTLPGKARAAYIITEDNKLYYVDKLSMTSVLLAGVNDDALKKITEEMSEAAKKTHQEGNLRLGRVQLQGLCKKLVVIKQVLSPGNMSAEAEDTDAMRDSSQLLKFLEKIRGEIALHFNNNSFVQLTVDQKDNIGNSQDMMKSKLIPDKQPLIDYLVQLYLYHPEQYKMVMAERQLQEREHEVSEGVALFLKYGLAKNILAAMQKRSLEEVLFFAEKCNKTHLMAIPIMLSIIDRFNPSDFNALYKPPAKIIDLVRSVILPAGLDFNRRMSYFPKLLEFYLEKWAIERADDSKQGKQIPPRLFNLLLNNLARDFYGLVSDCLVSLLSENGGLSAEKILRYFDGFDNCIKVLQMATDPKSQVAIIKATLALDDESVKILFSKHEVFTYVKDLLRQIPGCLDESELAKLVVQEMMLHLKDKSINLVQDFLDFIKRYPVDSNVKIEIANQLRAIDDESLQNILSSIKINNNKDDLRAYLEVNVDVMDLAINLLPQDTIAPIVKNEEALLEIIRSAQPNKRMLVLLGIVNSLDAAYLRANILNNPGFLLHFLNEVPRDDRRQLIEKLMMIRGIKPSISMLTSTHVRAILDRLQDDMARLNFLQAIKYSLNDMITNKTQLNELLLAFDDKKYVVDIFKLCQKRLPQIVMTNNTVEGGESFPVAVLENYLMLDTDLQNIFFLEHCQLPHDSKFVITDFHQLDSIIKHFPDGTKPVDVMKILNIDALNTAFLNTVMTGTKNVVELREKLDVLIKSSSRNPDVFKYVILGLLKDYINEVSPTLGLFGRLKDPSDKCKAAIAFRDAILHNTPIDLLHQQHLDMLHKSGSALSDLYSLYNYFNASQNVLKRTFVPDHIDGALKMVVLGAENVDNDVYIRSLGPDPIYVLNDNLKLRCQIQNHNYAAELAYQEKNLKQHPYYRMSGGIIVFDMTKPESFTKAKEMYEGLIFHLERNEIDKPNIMLVGLNYDSKERVVSDDEVTSFMGQSKIKAYASIAANNNTFDMNKSFMKIVKATALEKYPQVDVSKRLIVDKDLKFLMRFKPDAAAAGRRFGIKWGST